MAKVIKEKYFRSLIWCTYRKNMKKALLSDQYARRYVQTLFSPEANEMSLTARRMQTKVESTQYTDDMGWGCTIRVG